MKNYDSRHRPSFSGQINITGQLGMYAGHLMTNRRGSVGKILEKRSGITSASLPSLIRDFAVRSLDS